MTGKPSPAWESTFATTTTTPSRTSTSPRLTGQTFPLFRNRGKGNFQDASNSSGVARLTVKRSGWSNAFADFNNDGWKDLFTANSHVNDQIEHFEPTTYQQANTILV